MKCQECVFWNQIQNRQNFGKCACPKFVYTDGFRDPRKQSDSSDLFICWDPEEMASFETGKDFGCIHFKGKEATP